MLAEVRPSRQIKATPAGFTHCTIVIKGKLIYRSLNLMLKSPTVYLHGIKPFHTLT